MHLLFYIQVKLQFQDRGRRTIGKRYYIIAATFAFGMDTGYYTSSIIFTCVVCMHVLLLLKFEIFNSIVRAKLYGAN